MEPTWQPSPYPYLISVRGGEPVPARKEGRFYHCAYQAALGLVWAPQDVRVLEHDPNRDFYVEVRDAYLAEHPEARAQLLPKPESPNATVPEVPRKAEQPPLWEQVPDHPGGRRSPEGVHSRSSAPRHAPRY